MLFYDPTLAAIAIGGAALNVGLLTLMQRVLQDIVLRLQTEMASCTPSRSWACNPSRR